MESRSSEATWERLAALLGPIHPSAIATARRLCRSRADGDDLYQESVLRAFDKLHTLRDESCFRSWFYATLLSRHRSRCRRMFWKRQIPLEEAFAGGRDPVGEDGGKWGERIQHANRAAFALAALDSRQREVIVLFEIDGYTIEEIADMQRASISAVKSRLTRGRLRLRRYYELRGWGGAGASPAAEADRTEQPPSRGPSRPAVPTHRLATMPVFESVKERSHE
jgi:RNA polymerase sigma-70 factor (ECF subfamily)